MLKKVEKVDNYMGKEKVESLEIVDVTWLQHDYNMHSVKY